MSKKWYFTSESVTEGHPDKLCDYISDTILDEALKQDKYSRVAIETFASANQITIAGQLTTNATLDIEKIVRDRIKEIGYDRADLDIDYRTCKIDINITKQSSDIAQGVDIGGAGDQGIMFGYASDETEEYMPYSAALAQKLARQLTKVRKDGTLSYLRPDGKTQVTVEYDENNKPVRLDAIVVSSQHAPEVSQEQIHTDIKKYVIDAIVDNSMVDDDTKIYINPTGRFVIGGPNGDSGLTGRKIIVDTYGGKGAHGGGAFSGKDPSKVDRSAAYAARHIAKNMVAAGVADEMLVQVSYAIGVARPINIYVNTYGRSNVKMTDGEIAQKIDELFDLRPKAIEERLKLRNPIYEETASYGHMGREPKVVTKTYESMYHEAKTMEVELFTWEKLDYVDKIKEAFGL